MSIVKSEDSKKWINAFLAGVAILVGFVTIRFLDQMGEWFDLEAKVGNFLIVSQGTGLVVGVITFISILKSRNTMKHLQEVYDELVKVVWPDKDSVIKLTVGIIVGLTIVSGLFVLVDYLSQQLLSIVY